MYILMSLMMTTCLAVNKWQLKCRPSTELLHADNDTEICHIKQIIFYRYSTFLIHFIINTVLQMLTVIKS